MTFFSPAYRLLPDTDYFLELARPWKLSTLALGMSWLLYGALMYGIGDWDVGISLVMGGLTYLCAPWSVHVLGSALRFRPSYWWLHALAAVAVAVFVVDTSYVAYHAIAGNPTYRDANFSASMPLYFLAGTAWLYRGTLRSFNDELRAAIRATRQP